MILRLEKTSNFETRIKRARYYEFDTARSMDRWLDGVGNPLNDWDRSQNSLELLRRWLKDNEYWREVDPIDPDLQVDEGL